MKPAISHAWRLLRRDARSRELRLLVLALLVAVATVTAIALFAEHLQQTILRSSSQFLAADRQLQSPRPVDPAWLDEARRRGLQVAYTLEFASMLFGNQGMQLVSVKAVSDNYPLKGRVDLSDQLGAPSYSAAKAPPRGSLWLAPRLFPLLHLQLGEQAAIGDANLKVEKVLQREPDASFSFSALSPRVLMNWADIDATHVVQPGSRLSYQYLFAGTDAQLQGYEAWLKPRLRPSDRWRDVKSGRPAIADTLDKADRYLLLAGSLAVILAALAIAMTSRQYAQQQFDRVALLKTLGQRGSRINRDYLLALLGLGLVASLLGLALGWIGQQWILAALSGLLPDVETHLSLRALAIGLLTALTCLLAFAVPPLWALRHVAPVRVLRRDWQSGAGAVQVGYGLGVAAVILLLWVYARDLLLVLWVSGGLLAVTLVFAGLAWLLLRSSRIIGTRAGSFWRLGLSAIARRRGQSVLQIVVFAMAMMLLVIIYLLRTSLISDWQAQLPEHAPNHFLINIAPSEVDAVAHYLQQQGIKTAGLYPMVRGRLTEINGKPAAQVVTDEQEVHALHRELNLTWMDKLPADNQLVSGKWWPQDVAGTSHQNTSTKDQPAPVSVEVKLAQRLGLKLGDRLRFRMADRQIEAQVASLRSVQWDSMQPNFFVIFQPGALNDFPATYITSAYLSPAQKPLLNGLSNRFPTITVLELDQLVEKIRQVMAQVSLAVEWVLLMILAAALLVIAALVNVSMAERLQESALLRALGAGRRIVVGGLCVEFAVIGALSGLVAIAGAEATVWELQERLFKLAFHPHPWLWLLTPLIGALLVGLLGYLQSLRVVRVAPIQVLRQLQ